jgi:hypothetical protein
MPGSNQFTDCFIPDLFYFPALGQGREKVRRLPWESRLPRAVRCDVNTQAARVLAPSWHDFTPRGVSGA